MVNTAAHKSINAVKTACQIWSPCKACDRHAQRILRKMKSIPSQAMPMYLENDRVSQTLHAVRAGTMLAGLEQVCDLAVSANIALLLLADLLIGILLRICAGGGRSPAPNRGPYLLDGCWARHVWANTAPRCSMHQLMQCSLRLAPFGPFASSTLFPRFAQPSSQFPQAWICK